MKQLECAVFLDRDGTILVEKDYLSSPNHIQLIPRSATAIKELNTLNIPIIVITNQSGIARGYFSENDLQRIHTSLNKELSLQKAYITEYFYCPHHPTIGESHYRKECNCRKPKIGMVLQAQKKYNFNLHNSFVVGDKCSDIQLAKTINATSIMVSTGYGTEEYQNCKEIVDFYATDLYNAVQYIKRTLKQRETIVAL